MAIIPKSIRLDEEYITYAETINPNFTEAIKTIIDQHRLFATQRLNIDAGIQSANWPNTEIPPQNIAIFIPYDKITDIDVLQDLEAHGFEQDRYYTVAKEADTRNKFEEIMQAEIQKALQLQNDLQKTLEINTNNEIQNTINPTADTTTTEINTKQSLNNTETEIQNSIVELENTIKAKNRQIDHLKNTITVIQNKELQENGLQNTETQALIILVMQLIQSYADYSSSLKQKLTTKASFTDIFNLFVPQPIKHLFDENTRNSRF